MDVFLEPCKRYKKLIDFTRSIGTHFTSVKQYRCDSDLKNEWYRFEGGELSQRLHEDCAKSYGKCSTLSGGWMQGQHPQGWNFESNLEYY